MSQKLQNMPNIVDRFSTHLREVLVGSIRIATELKNQSVEPTHLLLALSMQKGSIANEVLNRYQLDTKSIEKVILKLKQELRGGSGRAQNKFVTILFKLQSSFRKSAYHCPKKWAQLLGTEHLLSALINLNDPQIEELFKKGGRVSKGVHSKIPLNQKSRNERPVGNCFKYRFSIPPNNRGPEAIDRLQDSLSEDALLQTILPTDKKNKKKKALWIFLRQLTHPDIQSGLSGN